MQDIATRHLFTLSLPAGGLQAIGKTPVGDRRIGLLAGGTFTGERLRGRVLPGGADWITLRPDGAFALDVRAVLETDDKALIALTYRGLRHGPAETMARLGRGEPVDPSEYYMRAIMSFETGAPGYDWLNRAFAVGTGRREPDGAVYEVHEVL